MIKVEGSFRDPNGFMFWENNILYRQVNKSYQEEYDFLMSSGLYQQLTNKEMLISHEEQDNIKTENYYKLIKPEIIPFISYPYEWSFSQYQDAAILTLDICLKALKKDMILKDASSYNIQFLRGKPIFIDTLSFDKYQKGQTWDAYGQFCRHFFAPLLLMAKISPALAQMMRIYIDGLPLELVSSLLPTLSKFNLGVYLHIHLHGKKQNDGELSNKKLVSKQLDKKSLEAILTNLRTNIINLKIGEGNTEWGNYYEKMLNYSDKSFANKVQIVEKFLLKTDAKFIGDMGANKGEFSKIASQLENSYVVSYDIDHTAVDKHYQALRANNIKNILPLILDLTNPSPAIGFDNNERLTVGARSNWDCVMALAVIHHLAISNNLPFEQIADYFAKLAKFLIIEFVPKGDSQVEKLLLNRKDIFPCYTIEYFEEIFTNKFTLLEKESLVDSTRVLYLFARKEN